MTIVVDTSVIIKWFVSETGHEDAICLLQGNDRRLCPDIALVEAANALRSKLRMNDISAEQMNDAIRRLPVYFKNVVPSVGLLEDACMLAAKLDHSVYDCMFLALALQESEAVVVTSDTIFLKKCIAAGFGNSIRHLEDHLILTQAKSDPKNG